MEETTKFIFEARIDRITRMGWRGTPTALFQRSDGYYLVECWFENDEPRVQIRSSAHSLQEMALVRQALELAREWFLEIESTKTAKPHSA